jgi:hypothetical protein
MFTCCATWRRNNCGKGLRPRCDVGQPQRLVAVCGIGVPRRLAQLTLVTLDAKPIAGSPRETAADSWPSPMINCRPLSCRVVGSDNPTRVLPTTSAWCRQKRETRHQATRDRSLSLMEELRSVPPQWHVGKCDAARGGQQNLIGLLGHHGHLGRLAKISPFQPTSTPEQFVRSSVTCSEASVIEFCRPFCRRTRRRNSMHHRHLRIVSPETRFATKRPAGDQSSPATGAPPRQSPAGRWLWRRDGWGILENRRPPAAATRELSPQAQVTRHHDLPGNPSYQTSRRLIR